MKTIKISAHLRANTGKKETKKLRREDNVPCVMYGGEEIIHFYSHENEFKDLVYTPNVYIVQLDIDGKLFNTALKEIQFHPVNDKISHIDFIQVFDNKPVIMDIPVNITGESEGIKAGGKLRIKRRSLKVKGFAKDLPDVLDIDITDLVIGQSIKVHQLNFTNLELLDPQRAMIVAVATSRLMALDEDIEEEEEEGEEGEEGAEGEEGETGATDDKGTSSKDKPESKE